MVKTITIGAKLTWSFAAMLALVLILGAASLKVNLDLGAQLDNAVRVTAKMQMLAGQILAAAAEMTSLERGVSSSTMLQQNDKVQSFQQQCNEVEKSVREYLAEFKTFANSAGTTAQLDAVTQEEQALQQSHGQGETAGEDSAGHRPVAGHPGNLRAAVIRRSCNTTDTRDHR